MSALLRNPASVPSLFSRSVEEDARPSQPGGRWRGAMRVLRSTHAASGVATAGAALVAALIDVPLVQAASRVAASVLAN